MYNHLYYYVYLHVHEQVFEAMGEYLSEEHFMAQALPRMERIAATLKQRCPSVPLMVFPRGAPYAIPALQKVSTRTNNSSVL